MGLTTRKKEKYQIHIFPFSCHLNFIYKWFGLLPSRSMYRLHTTDFNHIVRHKATYSAVSTAIPFFPTRNKKQAKENSFWGVIVEAKHASMLLAAREIQYQQCIALTFNGSISMFLESLFLLFYFLFLQMKKCELTRTKEEENMTEYHRCNVIASYKAKEVIAV